MARPDFTDSELCPPLADDDFARIVVESLRRTGRPATDAEGFQPANGWFRVNSDGAKLPTRMTMRNGEEYESPFPFVPDSKVILPSSDQLLHLTTMIGYWSARESRLRGEFDQLKAVLTAQAAEGVRDQRDLDTLSALKDAVDNAATQKAATEAAREPLFPRSMRPDTPEEIAADANAAATNAQFDSDLAGLQI